MRLRNQLTGLLAGTTVCLALAAPVKAEVSTDALLDKLVAKGILKPEEAAELKNEATNTPPAKGIDFKLSKAIKSVEVFGDVRMRYENRSAQLGPEAGQYAGEYDAANRWRYAVRLGVRGDLVDDYYYGLRVETSPNERSPWNTVGNAAADSLRITGRLAKPTTTGFSSARRIWGGARLRGWTFRWEGSRNRFIPHRWFGIQTTAPKAQWRK